jgi:23S rRNA (guanosine2251-2'-O)-methyltransferase
LYRLWIQKGLRKADVFLDAAKRNGIAVKTINKSQLTDLAGDSSHQGVVLEVGQYQYCQVDDMLAMAEERDEKPFLLLMDLLHGPQNIGTLLRTAEACGVHGVILQDRRAPDITPSVVVYSAGAAEHLLVSQVTNLVRTIEQLKAADVWIVGLDLVKEAEPLGRFDLNLPLGIVVGHEGSGLRRLVRERCDFLLAIPMRGRVNSLNAATAGAVILYSAWQARGFEGAS